MVQDAEFRGEVYQSKDDTKIARAGGEGEQWGVVTLVVCVGAHIYNIYDTHINVHTSVMYMDGYNVCIV